MQRHLGDKPYLIKDEDSIPTWIVVLIVIGLIMLAFTLFYFAIDY